MLTLIAPAVTNPAAAARLSPPYSMRACRPADIEPLGRLYFDAYDRGVAAETLEAAIADVRACFAGEYGELCRQASLIASYGSRLVAAVLTVHRAPWDGTPPCPFIIEMFTSPAHRRRGLAGALMVRVMLEAQREGCHQIALRVAEDNEAAVALYRRLGFRPWCPRDA